MPLFLHVMTEFPDSLLVLSDKEAVSRGNVGSGISVGIKEVQHQLQ